jgi:predicted DNA-binding transcriptional regulator AlpA
MNETLINLIGSTVLTKLTGGLPVMYGQHFTDDGSYWQVTPETGTPWAAATPAELVELMVKDAYGLSVEAISHERATHLLTAKAVVELKGVKLSAVYKAVQRGTLKSWVAGRILFRLSDVEQWTPGATRGRKAKEVPNGG